MNYLLLGLFFCACLSADESPIVYLTWQNDPTSTMTINWLTPKDEEKHEIEYAMHETDTSAWEKKAATVSPLPLNAPYTINTIELTALKADTLYRFRIKPSIEEHLFRTMPSSNMQQVRFVVGGDLYDKDLQKFEKTAQKVASQNPRFVLVGGDLAYSMTKRSTRDDDFSRWHTFLSSWSKLLKDTNGVRIPILPTIGNHETKGFFKQTPKDAPFFYALFATPGPQGYKMMRFGNYLSIALLDSGVTHPIPGEQTDWLKKELSTQQAITHRFALYHVTAFPSVRSYRASIPTSIRRHWCPLFETYGIHAAFENHDHAYKRTFPLINSSVDPFGVVYFGDGGWGTKIRIPKTASRTSYLAKTAATSQFLQVDLTRTTRTYTSISPDGIVIDSYTQQVNKPNTIK